MVLRKYKPFCARKYCIPQKLQPDEIILATLKGDITIFTAGKTKKGATNNCKFLLTISIDVPKYKT